MNILFVHQNYPAQFRNLAAAIGANPANHVVFISGPSPNKDWALPGVMHVPIEQAPRVNTMLHPWVQASDLAIRNGECAVRTMAELKRQGFRPDFVINHAGSGFGLFVKDLFPSTILVNYFEWFFRDATLRACFPDATPDELVAWKRTNMSLLEELECCDRAITPTQWQYEQLPKVYQSKTQIIFDGIDTNFFTPQPIQHPLHLTSLTSTAELDLQENELVITYATRGMEPIRGFPEFMRLVPDIQSTFPNAQIVVAGEDRSCYGPSARSHQGSWKALMLDELSQKIGFDPTRLHFVGSLAYDQYRNLLCRSDLHCYFTRPYVPSWSLYEAAACGSRIFTNRCAATEDITTAGRLAAVDLDDQQALNTAAIEALQQVDPQSRKEGESFLPQQQSVDSCLHQWNAALKELVAARQTAT